MKNDILRGIKSALPITLGYLPLGMAFGMLAVQQGLNVYEIFFMSLMVFAGSGQYIAASMIASGSEAIAVIATTFLVNLRHLLMSASLSPYLKEVSIPKQIVIAAALTDETYAADITNLREENNTPYFYMSLNVFSHFSWIFSTVMGGLVGSVISDPSKWGLDYALAAMFIGLLSIQADSKKSLVVGIASGFLSIIAALYIKGSYNIIIASVLAAFLGVCIELWTQKSYS